MYFLIYCQNWAQITKLKPNQTLLDSTYSNLTSFLSKKYWSISKSFPNLNFSVFWLKWTQTMKVKQNETFFHETYSNLTLFLIHCKTLKHFKEFCNWHRSISQQKGAQVKWNEIRWNMCKTDSICPFLQSITVFQWHLKFISWWVLSQTWMITVP